MKKPYIKILLCTLAIMSSTFCWSDTGNWVSALDYVQVDETDGHLSLSAAAVSFGYKFPLSEKFALTPLALYGTGLNEDGLSSNGPYTKVKLNGVGSLSVRGEFQIIGGLYGFVAPTWTWLKMRATADIDGFSFKKNQSMTILG